MVLIKFKSLDNVIVEAELEVALQFFGVIKDMVDSIGMQEGEDAVIPLPNVKAATLKLVLEWVYHHTTDPTPPTVKVRGVPTTIICPWDADFLSKVNRSTLFDIILAANFLDIKGLMAVTTQTLANQIKGKSVEQIRRQFNIVNNCTTAKKTPKENGWI